MTLLWTGFFVLSSTIGCWAQQLVENGHELEGSGFNIRQAVENTIVSGNQISPGLNDLQRFDLPSAIFIPDSTETPYRFIAASAHGHRAFYRLEVIRR